MNRLFESIRAHATQSSMGHFFFLLALHGALFILIYFEGLIGVLVGVFLGLLLTFLYQHLAQDPPAPHILDAHNTPAALFPWVSTVGSISVLIATSYQAHYIALGFAASFLFILFILLHTPAALDRTHPNHITIQKHFYHHLHFLMMWFTVNAGILLLGFGAFIFALAPAPYTYAHLVWSLWLWGCVLAFLLLNLMALYRLYQQR